MITASTAEEERRVIVVSSGGWSLSVTPVRSQGRIRIMDLVEVRGIEASLILE